MKKRKKVTALIQCEIRWVKTDKIWRFFMGGRIRQVFIGTLVNTANPVKAILVKSTIAFIKDQCSSDKDMGFSLRIATKDGRYSEERTYPRSLDPRKSKG